MGNGKQTLIKKGAEASLYLAEWHGKKVMIKKRLPKHYRPSRLDEQIRTFRTVHEPQLLHEAKLAGVPTPMVFLVDAKEATVIMEFIEGKQVKQLLSDVSENERRNFCFRIGELIGKLHRKGVIHGDLTTSNMILSPEGKIFFVDFGLGEKTEELEVRGVDLHLMKRALQSTHFRYTEGCFASIVEGYSKILGVKTTREVLEKMKEIERRGRYVAKEEVKGSKATMNFRLEGKVIFFATNNINKFNEARRVLAKYNISVGMLRVKTLEIQSQSIEEIARTSVIDAFKNCHLPVIVEDAGLFIDALNGFPGPYAAYVYKTVGNDGLLRLMEKVNDRKATFKSVVAFYSADCSSPICFEGEVNGEISEELRKTEKNCGFGFDPVFKPAGKSRTFAEMSMAEKNMLSHRAKALTKFALWYRKLQQKP